MILIFLFFAITSCRKLGTNEAGEFKVLDLEQLRDGEVVTFELISKSILADSCVSCHGWAETEEGVSQYVVAGEPEQSKLYTRLVDPSLGTIMPKGAAPLSQQKIDLIRDYILGKAEVPVIEIKPEPVPENDVDEVDFKRIKNEVFIPHCQSCHRNEVSSEDSLLAWSDFFGDVMITPGNAGESELFQKVDRGDMPVRAPRLEQEKVDLLKKYINQLKIPVEQTTVDSEIITFQQLSNQLLQNRCFRCHSSEMSSEETMLSWTDLFGNPVIEPGNPEHSIFYEVLKSGEMPKASQPLTIIQLQLVNDYIKGLAN